MVRSKEHGWLFSLPFVKKVFIAIVLVRVSIGVMVDGSLEHQRE